MSRRNGDRGLPGGDREILDRGYGWHRTGARWLPDRWIGMPSQGPPPVANAYSLDGPTSGLVSVASTPFSVQLNGTVAGTVTVTPSDSGGGGTFIPTTVALTTASPSATFTYTPASTGTKTISTTNNGGLGNPTGISYVVGSGAGAGGPLVDGDPVSSWTDSSGNGHTATMTGSNRPTFKTAIVNGKPVVRFTSVGASKLNLATPVSDTPNYSIFVVLKATGPTVNCLSLVSSDSALIPVGVCETPGSGSGALLYANRTHFATVTTDYSGAFHVLYMQSGASGSGAIGYGVDGSVMGALPDAPLGPTSAGSFHAIGYRPGDLLYSNGDIAEILIYNPYVSSPTDYNNINKYLGTKYGIAVAGGGTAVDPSTVSGLAGWWKADSLAPPDTGLTDGSPVTAWGDSSGFANHARQTGSARPTFKTNVVNGKPVVRFASATSQLLNLASAISSVSPFAILAVMKPASSSSGYIYSIGGSAGFNPMGPFGNANDSTIFYGDRANYYNVNTTTIGPVPEWRTAFHVHVFRTAAPVRLDGSTYGPGTGANPYTGDFDVIGGSPSTAAGGPYFSTGDIAEIIVYAATVADTDIANVEKYLGTKYGITVAGGSAVQPDTVTGLVGWWKADSLL